MDEWVSKIQINAKKINDLICSSFFAWHGIEAANMQRRSCGKNIVQNRNWLPSWLTNGGRQNSVICFFLLFSGRTGGSGKLNRIADVNVCSVANMCR